jgi:hypothetical protein
MQAKYHDISKQPKWVQMLISSLDETIQNLKEELSLLKKANLILNDKTIISNVVEFEKDDYIYMIKKGEIVPVFRMNKGDIILVGKTNK